jgi:hypothetical protein
MSASKTECDMGSIPSSPAKKTMTTRKQKDAQAAKDLALKKKYDLNAHRSLIEDKEVFSFLNHISQHTVGRIPEQDDDYDEYGDHAEDPQYLQEEIPPDRFLDIIHQFIENCQNGGRIIKVEIQGSCDTYFGSGNTEAPAFQIFVTKATQRFETDAEVIAKLRKLDAKKTLVAKIKKTR